MTTKIYDALNALNGLGENITYKSGDPQLIYDYSSLGTSINIKYIPEDYTNVLYFDGDVYRLDHDLGHEPIVLYKIPPDTGDGGVGNTSNTSNTSNKCYYERRQLEIHHVNNSGKKLVLVIPFRSSNILMGNRHCDSKTTVQQAPNPNSLDLSSLMGNIEDQDKVYYEEDDDTITIFYTEQYVEWNDDESFWNGSFMDLPQLQKLKSLCDGDNGYGQYKGCVEDANDNPLFYGPNEYPDDLSYNDNYIINYANPYLNYHYLSSENEHKRLTNETDKIYAIRNGTEYNESILKSTLRSDAAGLGLDTTSGGSDDDDGGNDVGNYGEGTDNVDDNEIVIDCSPINTTEEEIITKMDKDSLLKLNSGYTFNNIIKDITNAINNVKNEGFREGNPPNRNRNFNVALNKELKKLEEKFVRDITGDKGRKGATYVHYKENYVIPIAETILGIIVGIISCIIFNIILNKVLKNR